jgi:hypothetical protein
MPYKNPEDKKRYRNERRKKHREKCKKLGICTTEGCNEKPLNGKARCENHILYNNEVRHKWGKTIEGKFKYNKSRIIKRKGIWQLTLDQYKVLAHQNCEYCDGAIDGEGVGLDQIIPRGGYVIGNVVPCCHVCNRIKMEIFTRQEMMELKPTLIKFRLARNGRWSKFAKFRWGDYEEA